MSRSNRDKRMYSARKSSVAARARAGEEAPARRGGDAFEASLEAAAEKGLLVGTDKVVAPASRQPREVVKWDMIEAGELPGPTV